MLFHQLDHTTATITAKRERSDGCSSPFVPTMSSFPRAHQTPTRPPIGPRPTRRTPTDPLFHHPHRRHDSGSSDELSAHSSSSSLSPVPGSPPLRDFPLSSEQQHVHLSGLVTVLDPSLEPHSYVPVVVPTAHRPPNCTLCFPTYSNLLPPRPVLHSHYAESLTEIERFGRMARTTAFSDDGLVHTAPQDDESIASSATMDSSNSSMSMEFTDSEQEHTIHSATSSLEDQDDTYCEVGGVLDAVRRFFFGAKRDRPPRNPLEECMLCPIEKQFMMDPVMDPDGHSYERRAILTWLQRNSISPLTRRPLAAHQLIENRALKAAIHEYLDGGYADRSKKDGEGISEA